ncbi:uncharacterized protein VICG_01488 [Vittaforma corneae ATCC 50505]|uniref:ABC transporter domain-containing protein n=1 Tax=Vittaforma corneae (strain ATCC 50505) TaxID=993615 RepID=L2GLI6_VITCO|nr:uncharacterized protein VICG_01488 [Vittaforma corneae ATCC 50505]ELA41504.1 hypothetical protein VICG_01488 [Vittaforma corneae ATCC 50505]
MPAKGAMSRAEFFNSLKMSYNFFSKRTRHPNIYIALIFALISMRGWMDFYEKGFRDMLEKRPPIKENGFERPSIVPGEMIVFMMLKLWWWSIDFVSKMTFEVLITPIGGIIAQYILTQMIFTEDPTVFDVVPSYCEYVITESSKAIAKIVRLLFVNMSNCFVQLCSDFYFIFVKDISPYKKNSLSFICFMVIIAFLKLYHLQKVFYINNEASDVNSEKEKQYIETMDLFPVVKMSGEEKKMMSRYSRTLNRWENLTIKGKVLLFSNDFVFNLLCDVVVSSITILYIANKNENSEFEMNLKDNCGEISNFNRVLVYIPNCFISAMKFYRDLAESVVLSQKLMIYLDYIRELKNEKIRISSFSESIEVKDLSYTCKDKLVFNNVSFVISRGSKVVLFGKNGTGKSSIFKLLLGFDKYRGTILFDGIELSRLCISDYRRLITYVPQDTRLFDESIYYNLAYGNSKSFKEIIEECKSMGIHDAIMSFPSGYNTGVGEGGKSINGGLKQKIFYTRAFLRDSEIYLFDEPTNNLDANHSRFLLEYIRSPRYAEKTFFVICHDRDIANEFPTKFRLDKECIEVVERV